MEDFYKEASNQLIIVKENGEKIINPPSIENLTIKSYEGGYNTITLHEPFHFESLSIVVTGDMDIEIQAGCYFGSKGLIKKSRNTKKNKLEIGRDFHCGSGCTIDLTDSGDVIIGDDAKWSWNIYIKSDDTHPVFDINTKECVNKSAQTVIGNHVWIGMNAVILKNSIIPDNSVIGAYSVVAKKFDEENVVIAGNPARICKRNINWTHGSVEGYCLKNNKG